MEQWLRLVKNSALSVEHKYKLKEENMTEDVKKLLKMIEDIKPKETITPISGAELKEKFEDKNVTFYKYPGIYKWGATKEK